MTKRCMDQKKSNGFMRTEVHIWHLLVCEVSFLVTLKHHPGPGLSLTWQFATVFTWLLWKQRDWQTLVCPQLLSVVSKESTLRPSCCVWVPAGLWSHSHDPGRVRIYRLTKVNAAIDTQGTAQAQTEAKTRQCRWICVMVKLVPRR